MTAHAMSRRTLAAVFLAIVFALLAIGLFAAGAWWRGHMTAPSTASVVRPR
jgi:hypothetical protein